MIRILLAVLLFTVSASGLKAQKVDSIFFHLYTDSLKKGQHNYINVDGKLSNGRWLPLTSKELNFSCDEATFEGNELVIPENFKEEKVTVKATLKTDHSVTIQKTIWIKQKPDPELPKRDDMINKSSRRNY
ncbi:MAG TPA: hypothetical protein PKC72_11910 [Chitinophagaceae bacterium]|nr:hypothetical protein [Chitinophagaceae bacterium]